MSTAVSRLLLAGLLLGALGCPGGSSCLAGTPPDEATQEARRRRLVRVLQKEITDGRVLEAVGKVPRHRFVGKSHLHQAYANHPLPIGLEQTISQPFIVAYMTQALKLDGSEKVLEVGTGSGYQAAVLAETAGEVYSVEILSDLSARAQKVLKSLGYKNVHLRVGDGYDGWPEQAPFDAIMVTAAPTRVPPPLVAQLKEGGRLSIPLGEGWDQVLCTYVKREGRLVKVDSLPVRFVPMTGKALHH
jgi:protein-L-isoaspartate(D-aspartate) O-methyltransferase